MLCLVNSNHFVFFTRWYFYLLKRFKMKQKNITTNITKIIGTRIKSRRIMLGMSQSDLAKLCGVSFQQIQKYESGQTNISCERLFQISNSLTTPIDFFFDTQNKMYNTKSLNLLILYWKLPENKKKLVFEMIKNMK